MIWQSTIINLIAFNMIVFTWCPAGLGLVGRLMVFIERKQLFVRKENKRSLQANWMNEWFLLDADTDSANATINYCNEKSPATIAMTFNVWAEYVQVDQAAPIRFLQVITIHVRHSYSFTQSLLIAPKKLIIDQTEAKQQKKKKQNCKIWKHTFIAPNIFDTGSPEKHVSRTHDFCLFITISNGRTHARSPRSRSIESITTITDHIIVMFTIVI